MAYSREYYEANKEKIRERNKNYYLKNKDKFSSYSKKWKENNKEKVKESGKKYREAHKEQLNEYSRQHREQRLETYRKYNRAHAEDRIINSAILIEYKGGKCEICGLEYNGKNGPVFDFHHLNPEEKDFNISTKIKAKTIPQKVYDEVDKCILVCSNCHRMLHSKKY